MNDSAGFNNQNIAEIQVFMIQRRSFRANIPVVIFYLISFPLILQFIGAESLGTTDWAPIVGLTFALIIYCGWKYAFLIIPAHLIAVSLYIGIDSDFLLNAIAVIGISFIYAFIGWLIERGLNFLEKVNFQKIIQILFLLGVGSIFLPTSIYLVIERYGYELSRPSLQLGLLSALDIIAGILYITPFLLAVVFPFLEDIPQRSWHWPDGFHKAQGLIVKALLGGGFIRFLEILVIIILLSFTLQPSISQQLFGSHSLVYLTLIPIIWIGINYSPLTTLKWVFIIDSLIILGASSIASYPLEVFERQTMIIAISLMGYVLAGVVNDRQRTLTLLHEEEDKYHSIIRQTTEGIVLIDIRGIIMDWNKGMEVITQIPAEEAIEKPWYEIHYQLSGSDKDSITLESFKHEMNFLGLEKESMFTKPMNNRFLLKDGTEREVLLQASTVRSEAGFHVVLIVRDISEEIGVRLALQESEEQFRGIVKWADEGIALFNQYGEIVEWNKGIERITAISREEALNQPILELGKNLVVTDLDGKPLSMEGVDFFNILGVIQRQTRSDVVNLITNPLGEQYYVKYHVFTIKTSTGRLLCVVASDVSVLMETEMRLRRQGRVLNAVSEIAAELLESRDVLNSCRLVMELLGRAVDTDVVRLSRLVKTEDNQDLLNPIVFWKKPGASPDQDEEWQLPDVVVESGFPDWLEILTAEKIIECNSRELSGVECSYLQKKGIATILVVPVFAMGKCWGAITFVDFVSEREWLDAEKDALRTAADILGSALEKEDAEKELLESQATAWALLNAPQTGIVLLDRDGFMVSVNEVAAEAAEMDQEEMIHKHWTSVFSEQEPILHHEKCIQEVIQTGASIHTEWSYENNWIQSDYYPIQSEGGAVSSIAIFLRDVSESRSLQKEVEMRNQDLQALNSIMAAVTQSLEFPDIFFILKDSLERHLDVYGGLVLSGDPAITQFTIDLGWGLATESYRKIWQLALSEWNDWESIEEPFLVAVSSDSELLSSAHPLEMYAVPLRTQDRLQGIVAVVVSEVQGEDRSRMLFYRSLGQQVGVAVYNARLLGEIRKSQLHLKELTGEIVRAREKERRRVSRELHDEAGQALTALKIGLQILDAENDLNSRAARIRLEELVDLADSTMEQIRLLARDLRPPELEALGLNQTLENVCDEFERRTGLSTEYNGLELGDVGDEIAISLYRFLQEALTNVARHAYASKIDVALTENEEHMILEVRDNGCGFNVQEVLKLADRGKRMGLAGMGERLELIGGRLWITSVPAEGTRVAAEVPVRRGL